MTAKILSFPIRRKSKPRSYFGGCPVCGHDTTCMNIGRDCWFYCAEHKTKWYVGKNLFSPNYEGGSEEDDRNSRKLEAYVEVEPDHGGAA